MECATLNNDVCLGRMPDAGYSMFSMAKGGKEKRKESATVKRAGFLQESQPANRS
jgi:hypothetical protein